jgi:hypothetical protein
MGDNFFNNQLIRFVVIERAIQLFRCGSR